MPTRHEDELTKSFFKAQVVSISCVIGMATRRAPSRRPIMTNLSGKTALVTGASRGIGRASALGLARLGAQVLIHYGRAKGEAEAVAKEIRDAGGRADIVAADLAAPDGAHALANQVRAVVGDRLDILVA